MPVKTKFKNTVKEIDLIEILVHIKKKKMTIFLFTFFFMIIGFLYGNYTNRQKTVYLEVYDLKINTFSKYNNFINLDNNINANVNIEISEKKILEQLIFKKNILYFEFLLTLKKNLLNKKLLQSYLEEKNIDDSIKILCNVDSDKSLALSHCHNITITYFSDFSKEQIFDILNYFIKITQKNFKLKIKNDLENAYEDQINRFSNNEKLNFVEKKYTELFSELKSDDLETNFIENLSFDVVDQINHPILSAIIGLVFGFFISLFSILVRIGLKEFNLKKLFK
jgi:LPS O-antigen subunit length determinant protein (WzzB/FepE family)